MPTSDDHYKGFAAWLPDPGVRRMYGGLSYADGLRAAYGPGAFVADKEEYVAPDFFCPQCNKQAAPEHVSIFCEQRTGSYGEIEVVNGHKCKCWWCQTEWEEA